jgi:hypothetical protein
MRDLDEYISQSLGVPLNLLDSMWGKAVEVTCSIDWVQEKQTALYSAHGWGAIPGDK